MVLGERLSTAAMSRRLWFCCSRLAMVTRVFGLELLVAAGRGGHLLTLQGLQVLHFTFESAQ
jgi:hypothetical protein